MPAPTGRAWLDSGGAPRVHVSRGRLAQDERGPHSRHVGRVPRRALAAPGRRRAHVPGGCAGNLTTGARRRASVARYARGAVSVSADLREKISAKRLIREFIWVY